MRHAKHKYKLSRSYSLRKALIKSMVRNLLIHQRIRTTATRAKATRPTVEKLITMAKKGTLLHKRLAYEVLGDHALVSMLFTDIAPRFKDRTSGFTRILHIGMRRGDDAPLVVLELTEVKEKKKKPKAPKTEHAAIEPKAQAPQEMPEGEAKPKAEKAIATERAPEKQKPNVPKKPAKKFFGGIRSIFKKERDSL